MKIADVPPLVLVASWLVAGAVVGLGATKLADLLPARYGITHLVTGQKRDVRNRVLVVLCAVLGGLVAARLFATPEAPLGSSLADAAVGLVLGSSLLAGAAIDFEHLILPDEITFGGAIVGVATAYVRPTGFTASLVGALAGFLVSYVPFLLYKWIRGRSGMGLGDAKLLVMIGAWLGWQGAVFAMLVGSIQSVLVAVVMRAAGRQFEVPESVRAEIDELRKLAADGDEEAQEALDADPMAAEAGEGFLATRMPMGPFLGLGALQAFFGDRYVDAFWTLVLG